MFLLRSETQEFISNQKKERKSFVISRLCITFARSKPTAMQYLRQAIEEGEWQKVMERLDAMSNMEFRRAEAHVRTQVLPKLKNDELWTALLHLIRYRRQAFLSGVLAVEGRAKDGTLRFDCEGARELAQWLKEEQPESVSKAANMMLPLMQNEEQIEALLNTFETGNELSRIAALLKVDTPLCLYVLFCTLRRMHDGKALAAKCAQHFMKKGDDRAYNMAAIMKAYFGLDELNGRFALRIEPYELSMLDNGSEAFYHLLDGRRPKL